MATTLKEVQAFLDEAELKYKTVEEHDAIELVFDSRGYRTLEGKEAIFLAIQLLEGGEFVRIFSPEIYVLPDDQNALAMLQACLIAAARTKGVAYDYNPEGRTIGASVELPLEDAPLTSRQLHRAVRLLLDCLNRYHATIAGAGETGQIILPDPEEPKVEALLARILDLSFTGVQKVRAALASPDVETAVSAADPAGQAPEML